MSYLNIAVRDATRVEVRHPGENFTRDESGFVLRHAPDTLQVIANASLVQVLKKNVEVILDLIFGIFVVFDPKFAHV